jgi:hypothetical protein
MTDRRVVLYERTGSRHFWIVDAAITADGDLSICSGDGAAEWYAIVDRAATFGLVEALQKHLRLNADSPRAEDDVLDLLARAFSGGPEQDHGPFEAITKFLDQHGISWRSDFWGSL